MFKTFSAAALSLTLVMTSLSATATPARANNDDIAKVIFGALAIGIIAKGISDARADDHQPVATRPARNNQVTVTRPARNNHVTVTRPNRNHAQRIPARCAREARVGNRSRVATIYRRGCLRRAGIRTQRADNCVRTGHIRGRNVTYYTARCLRRSGFRL